MTNGTVGDLVVSNGRAITVRYADGEKKIAVPMDVPAVRVEVGDRSVLASGAHFLFFLKQDANGGQVIDNGVIGKDDGVPPTSSLRCDTAAAEDFLSCRGGR